MVISSTLPKPKLPVIELAMESFYKELLKKNYTHNDLLKLIIEQLKVVVQQNVA